MKKGAVSLPTLAAALAIALSLGGCSGLGSRAEAPVYRCEFGIEFSARFVDDTAILDGSRGYDVLYRPAGSTLRVYSNPRMAAEFGLGVSGREAILRYPLLPLLARCARD